MRVQSHITEGSDPERNRMRRGHYIEIQSDDLDQEQRSGTDRRSGEDRRKENGGFWNAFTQRFHERRIEKDRRSRRDRRVG